MWARLHTFGKGMGCHGAALAGSRSLTDFVMNYGSSFVYTTALPPHALISIACAYDTISQSNVHREKLWDNVRTFQSFVAELCSKDVQTSLIPSSTAVQGIMVRSNERCVAVLILKFMRPASTATRFRLFFLQGGKLFRINLHEDFSSFEKLDEEN